jgi:hypothetical protein
MSSTKTGDFESVRSRIGTLFVDLQMDDLDNQITDQLLRVSFTPSSLYDAFVFNGFSSLSSKPELALWRYAIEQSLNIAPPTLERIGMRICDNSCILLNDCDPGPHNQPMQQMWIYICRTDIAGIDLLYTAFNESDEVLKFGKNIV